MDVGLWILRQGVKRQPSEEWLARQHPAADQVVPSSTVPPCKFQIAVANQVDEAAQAFIAVMLILVMRCD